MRSASLGITEQAVKVPELMFRVHFGCMTKSPLHFTDIHRCIPPCSVSVTFASEESQWAWGLRRWASFPPLYPCGRLSRTLSRGSAFFGSPHPLHRVGQVYLCSLPRVGMSDMWRVYSCQLGLQFR